MSLKTLTQNLKLSIISNDKLLKELEKRLKNKTLVIPHNKLITGKYKIIEDLKPNWALCDNSRRSIKCKNYGAFCVSQTHLKIELSEDSDHYHVCENCAKVAIENNKQIDE